jgi:hypothetical protein
MWEGWGEVGDPRQKEIVEAMVRDGLVSEKTYYQDVNLTSLIIKAREVRRRKKNEKKKNRLTSRTGN